MDKKGKILVGIGLTILSGFGIYKFVKAYQQGMEELENQEKQETDDLKNAGVNTSKLKSEIKNDEKDFTKMLFVAARFNSDLDEDLFDINGDGGVIDNLDDRVIHVRQRIDTSKHGESRRMLDFLIDIPDYASQSYRGPKIGNFLTTFAETAKKMSEDLVKFSPKARHKLVGFVVISLKDKEGNDKIEYRRLKDVVYREFADEKHDGLTKFYEIEKSRLNTTGAFDYIKEADWLFINCPDLKKEDESLLIENIVLQYIISFPIRSNRPGELYGIDTGSGIECIKYLTEELYVGREDSRDKVTYQNLMFNAPNLDGVPDLSWYYTVDEKTNRVVIDNICEFYNEEEYD